MKKNKAINPKSYFSDWNNRVNISDNTEYWFIGDQKGKKGDYCVPDLNDIYSKIYTEPFTQSQTRTSGMAEIQSRLRAKLTPYNVTGDTTRSNSSNNNQDSINYRVVQTAKSMNPVGNTYGEEYADWYEVGDEHLCPQNIMSGQCVRKYIEDDGSTPLPKSSTMSGREVAAIWKRGNYSPQLTSGDSDTSDNETSTQTRNTYPNLPGWYEALIWINNGCGMDLGSSWQQGPFCGPPEDQSVCHLETGECLRLDDYNGDGIIDMTDALNVMCSVNPSFCIPYDNCEDAPQGLYACNPIEGGTVGSAVAGDVVTLHHYANANDEYLGSNGRWFRYKIPGNRTYRQVTITDLGSHIYDDSNVAQSAYGRAMGIFTETYGKSISRSVQPFSGNRTTQQEFETSLARWTTKNLQARDGVCVPDPNGCGSGQYYRQSGACTYDASQMKISHYSNTYLETFNQGPGSAAFYCGLYSERSANGDGGGLAAISPNIDFSGPHSDNRGLGVACMGSSGYQRSCNNGNHTQYNFSGACEGGHCCANVTDSLSDYVNYADMANQLTFGGDFGSAMALSGNLSAEGGDSAHHGNTIHPCRNLVYNYSSGYDQYFMVYMVGRGSGGNVSGQNQNKNAAWRLTPYYQEWEASPPPPTCFTAGTQIKMADGSEKNIEDVKVGDKVLGQNGINTVLELDHTILGDRKLYSINGGNPFVTAEHPLMTSDGWKSIDPNMTLSESHMLNHDSFRTEDSISRLDINDSITTLDGEIRISNIKASSDDYNLPLYNFELNGDNTYYANNYLAHNKCCFLAGTKISMADGSEKNIEDVEIGDMVKSWNEKTKNVEDKKVLELQSPVREGYYNLYYGENGKIQLTNEHPLFIKKLDGTTQWCSIEPEKTKEYYPHLHFVGQIETPSYSALTGEVPGDSIYTLDGEWLPVKGWEYVEEEVQTYNLWSIEDNKTFYANGVLAHNRGCDPEMIQNIPT